MTQLIVLAYLDPGSGSMVLQLLIGGILGGALFIKLQWRRIVGWFSRKYRESDEKGASPPDDQ